jgi:hypothetical protein
MCEDPVDEIRLPTRRESARGVPDRAVQARQKAVEIDGGATARLGQRVRILR